jgi:hypothetical protein
MSTTIKFMMAAAALVGATVVFSGATEERLDIRSPAGCPALTPTAPVSMTVSGLPARYRKWNSPPPAG